MKIRKINITDLLHNNLSAAISKFGVWLCKNFSTYTVYMLQNFSFAIHQIWRFRDENYYAKGLIYLWAVMLGIISFFAIAPVSSAATLIHVPFTSQAPFGNWAQPWQDFCEEASVVMAAHFLWGTPLTPKLVDAEMQIVKQYEMIIFKEHKDTSADETADILTHFFGFKNIRTRVVVTARDIKEELSHGNIVIVPAAGRLLKNPYFTPPGPLYHMLVIRGFDDNKNTFITNDPGTRRGNGFAYNQELLTAAIHDWNGGDVMNGKKVIIVVGR